MIADWPVKDIQLYINTACNMACHNCDAAVRIAPNKKEMMTVDQIKRFVAESNDLGIKWERILLIGGEPTIHPNLIEIINTIRNGLSIYKVTKKPGKDGGISGRQDLFGEEMGIESGIGLLSNGKKLPKMLEYYEKAGYVNVDSDNKETNDQFFYPVNIAPMDNPNFREEDNDTYATIQKYCQCPGFCLTPYGYYSCTTGFAISRVFGLDIGIKQLKDVSKESITGHFKQLCKRCGYFNEMAPFDVPEEHTQYTKETKLSPSWKKAVSSYRVKKPELTLY